MAPHIYHVYILANRRGRIYVGVTRDLRRRLAEHQQKVHPGYTQRHDITTLVYAEPHTDIRVAIRREKQIKRWPRWKKDRLIEGQYPQWRDSPPPPQLAPAAAPAG